MSNNDDNSDVILAAVEGGGTTFVVTIARLLPPSTSTTTTTTDNNDIIQIGNSKLQLLQSKTISSSTPSETLTQCSSFFLNSGFQYQGIGIATFGPVGLKKEDTQTYGRILPSSPKKEWRNVDVVSPILNACSSSSSGTSNPNNVPPPHKLETDVNAPAWAEYIQRNSTSNTKISSVAYVTVGTGVGVGLVINDKPVHGLMHPEGGHITVAPLNNDGFPGYSWGKEKSPYGGVNTVEGVTSSVALSERLAYLHQQQQQQGKKANNDKEKEQQVSLKERESLKDLPNDHILWDHAANAISNLCVSLILLTSVECIVLGGGVMNRTMLYDKIRTQIRQILNNYLHVLKEVSTEEGLKEFVTDSCWGVERGGLVGALSLALGAYQEEQGEVQKEESNVTRKKEQNHSSSGVGEKERDEYQRGMMTGITFTSAVIALSTIGFMLMSRRRFN